MRKKGKRAIEERPPAPATEKPERCSQAIPRGASHGKSAWLRRAHAWTSGRRPTSPIWRVPRRLMLNVEALRYFPANAYHGKAAARPPDPDRLRHSGRRVGCPRMVLN